MHTIVSIDIILIIQSEFTGGGDYMRIKRLFIIIACILLIGVVSIKYFPDIFRVMKGIQDENISIRNKENKVSGSESNKIDQSQTEFTDSTTPSVTSSDENTLTLLILKNMSIAQDTIVVIKDDSLKNNINTLAENIVNDYGYSGYISDFNYTVKGDTVVIHFNYRGGNDYFLRCINAVDSEVKVITSKIIKPGMSDFDKELAVHNYVVNNVIYDYEKLQNNTLANDDYTAYGALIEGKAVCQGYAEAVYRLLNAANIKNYIVSGTGSSNTAHTWNIVKIDGNYYHLDATFDDPVSNSGPILSYGYFNLSDSEIASDHTWDKSKYPKCTGDAENYYVVKHLIAGNSNDFYDIIKDGLQRKESIIRCKTMKYDINTFNPQVVMDAVRDNGFSFVNTSGGLLYDYNENTCEMQLFINYK